MLTFLLVLVGGDVLKVIDLSGQGMAVAGRSRAGAERAGFAGHSSPKLDANVAAEKLGF
jgi:hypothetical protein